MDFEERFLEDVHRMVARHATERAQGCDAQFRVFLTTCQVLKGIHRLAVHAQAARLDQQPDMFGDGPAHHRGFAGRGEQAVKLVEDLVAQGAIGAGGQRDECVHGLAPQARQGVFARNDREQQLIDLVGAQQLHAAHPRERFDRGDLFVRVALSQAQQNRRQRFGWLGTGCS